MTKTTLIFAVLAVFFLFGCRNEKNTKEDSDQKLKEDVKNKTVDNKTTETTSKSVQPENKTIYAEFDKVIAGTDGAIFLFIDSEGDSYDFYKDENSIGLEFTRDLQPNMHNPEFDDKWFEVSYSKKKKEFYDGGSGELVQREVMVIDEVKEIEKTSSNQSKTISEITAADLKASVFLVWNQTGP